MSGASSSRKLLIDIDDATAIVNIATNALEEHAFLSEINPLLRRLYLQWPELFSTYYLLKEIWRK